LIKISNIVHSGEWHILEKIHGFYFTFTQVLDYKYEATHKVLSITNPALLPCPKMAHGLKVTFNLKDFNTNFEKLNQIDRKNDINVKIEINKKKKTISNFERLVKPL